MKAIFIKKSKKGTYNVFKILDLENGYVGSVYAPVNQKVPDTITIEMIDADHLSHSKDLQTVS